MTLMRQPNPEISSAQKNVQIHMNFALVLMLTCRHSKAELWLDHPMHSCQQGFDLTLVSPDEEIRQKHFPGSMLSLSQRDSCCPFPKAVQYANSFRSEALASGKAQGPVQAADCWLCHREKITPWQHRINRPCSWRMTDRVLCMFAMLHQSCAYSGMRREDALPHDGQDVHL